MAALFEDHQRPVAGGEIDTVRALLHDLRQPLAAILLLAGTEGGDVGRKMDGIAGQARWLAELVETSLSEAAADEVRIAVDEAGILLLDSSPDADALQRFASEGPPLLAADAERRLAGRGTPGHPPPSRRAEVR